MNSTLDFKGGRPNNRAISASLPFTKRSFVPCRCQGRGSPWGNGRRLFLSSHPADPFPTLPSLSSPLDAPAVTPHSAPTSPPPAWLPRSLLAPLVPPPPLWSCQRRRTPSPPSSWTVAVQKASAVVWDGASIRCSGSLCFILPCLLLHVTIRLSPSPSDNTFLPSAF